MFFYEGQSCPVCGKHFAESDDVVACPQCGCPHHRDCWKQEGHCHFSADHGTEHQWAQGKSEFAKESEPATTVRCPNCGGDNPKFAEFCGHCGHELDRTDWSSSTESSASSAQQYTPPTGSAYTPPFGAPFQQPFQVPLQDPYGGVPRTEQIDGVTVDEIAELVGPNSAYYLPRFMQMSRNNSKISWNGAGFLIPYNWLLYRKNLLWGSVVFALWALMDLFSQFAVAALPTDMTYQALLNAMLTDGTYRLLMYVLVIVSIVDILLRLAIGLFGNYLYMRLILKKARKLRENPQPRYNRNFILSGGVSFALAAAPYVIIMVFAYAILLFMPIQ